MSVPQNGLFTSELGPHDREPAIGITDGLTAHHFTDRYEARVAGTGLSPIQKAGFIARLRALADQLEASDD